MAQGLARQRSISALVLLSTIAVAGGLAAIQPSVAHAGDEACSAKKFQFPAVEKACKEGGRKAAKDLMKAAVKKAKAAGKKYKCTSCHEDQKSFDLKKNAVEDLKPWI